MICFQFFTVGWAFGLDPFFMFTVPSWLDDDGVGYGCESGSFPPLGTISVVSHFRLGACLHYVWVFNIHCHDCHSTQKIKPCDPGHLILG